MPRFVLNDKRDDIILQDLESVRSKIAANITQEQQIAESQNKNNDKAFFTKSSFFILLNYNKRMKEARKRLEEVDNARWRDVASQLSDEQGKNIYDKEYFRALIFLLLKRYRDICDMHAADFTVVYIDAGKDFFVDYLQKPCSDLGISYLDLSDVLTQAATLRPLSFSIDPHYNAFTHRVIAEYLSDYLGKKYNLQKNKNYTYEFLGKFKLRN
jgi:hypothetical protein